MKVYLAIGDDALEEALSGDLAREGVKVEGAGVFIACSGHGGGGEQTHGAGPQAGENGRQEASLSEVVAAVKRVVRAAFVVEKEPAESGEKRKPDFPAGELRQEKAPKTLRERLERILATDRAGASGASEGVSGGVDGSFTNTGPSPPDGGEGSEDGRVVIVTGAKRGAGATTLCACLVEALDGLGAVHCEPAGTGYLYYGVDADEAHATGRYFTGCPAGARLAVIDGGQPESRALSVAVVEDSALSVNALRAFLAGATPGIVVVNRSGGGGPGLSVFQKEFPEIRHLYAVREDHQACLQAQASGRVPTAFGAAMAADVGKVAAAIREMLGI